MVHSSGTEVRLSAFRILGAPSYLEKLEEGIVFTIFSNTGPGTMRRHLTFTKHYHLLLPFVLISGCATHAPRGPVVWKSAQMSDELLPVPSTADQEPVASGSGETEKVVAPSFPASSPVQPAAFAQTESAPTNIAPTDNASTDNASTEIESGPGETRPRTLSDFQSLASANNPTIRQLAATTQKAAGFREQVGLRANPTIGYQGTQLADKGTDQNTAFIGQEVITGNKLALNRRVQNEALRSQLWELEAQRYRIATDVRVKFYEALAAQRRMEILAEFNAVTAKGLEIAELRRKANEGSMVESLQAKIQMNEVELLRQQAAYAFQGAGKELAALCGNPNMPLGPLEGELPQAAQPIEWSTLGAQLISTSPEIMAARSRVQRARALMERHGVQAIPNLTAQLAAGVDNGTNSGIVNFQIGAPIPVHNWNQGNIAAARAEYCRAVAEVQRLENAIGARLAAIAREYDSSAAALKKYSTEILPSARQTLELADIGYSAGEFGMLQVLIVRRTFIESNLQYLLAQFQVAQASARADGFALTGGLDPTIDFSGDDSLRGLTFSQQ